ncbi:hypothetical protein [Helcococcus bovis]|uniref:hypothetical protein n=1 Tax=Helcococcus bovis TaxID=3153252 RepID=UPI0038BD9613
MKFKNMLKKEILKYEKIRDKLKYDKFEDLEGSLIICNKDYYHKIKNKSTNEFEQKYIKKSEIKLAQSLAQKSYNKKVRNMVKKILPLMKKMYKYFDGYLIDDIYDNYSDDRKNLIIPVFETKGQYLERWKNTPYQEKGFDSRSNEIYTYKGKRVRSKTEKILADKFESLDIAYKYECPLNLGGRVIYPDFTFLDPYTCEEIYWEHFGIMDNPEYVESAIKKIEAYSVNGFKLICTFETANRAPSNQYVDCLINKYLLD